MSTICNFPTCDRKPESTGWCIFHACYSNAVVVKKAKPIKKESDARKEINKQLKKLAPQIIAKHPMCQIKSEKCTGKSECVHHVRGRLKDNILNEKTLLSVCAACNLWCETNTAEAVAKGFKKSRFKTD